MRILVVVPGGKYFMYPIVYMIIDTYYKGVIGLSVSNLGVSEL